MHISSSYAKIFGKQIFTHGSFPEVGHKQKTERKRERERTKVGNNNGQLCIAMPPRVAQAKPPGPKSAQFFFKRPLFRRHIGVNDIFFTQICQSAKKL